MIIILKVVFDNLPLSRRAEKITANNPMFVTGEENSESSSKWTEIIHFLILWKLYL